MVQKEIPLKRGNFPIPITRFVNTSGLWHYISAFSLHTIITFTGQHYNTNSSHRTSWNIFELGIGNRVGVSVCFERSCCHFYFDIKFGDRLYSKENRPGSPLLFWIKSVAKFDIKVKVTTWIGHLFYVGRRYLKIFGFFTFAWFACIVQIGLRPASE